MRLIDRFRPEPRAVQATPWGDWGDGAQSWAGTNVDNRTSLQLLTVYGCVRLIADSIATLPLDVFRKTTDGKTEAPTPRWLDEPAPNLDLVAWLTQLITSLLLDGNAYAWIERSGGQEPGIRWVQPLDPQLVHVRKDPGQPKQFYIDGRPYPAFNVLHVPAVMFPGAHVGMSPVEAARQSVGMGMAAQEYGARFFGQDATPPGVIETPSELTPDEARDMAKAWARRHSGVKKAHLPGVLKGGATWKTAGVTNEQAQFLETRRYTAAEIAGQMFLVDPSDLGIGVEGTSLTYANLEQRNVRRVQVTLLPWIVRLEHAISSLLFSPRFVKFNVSGLLRADTKTRYESYAIGIKHNFLLPSEAREFEDWPPVDGIDDKPLPGGSNGNDDGADGAGEGASGAAAGRGNGRAALVPGGRH